MWQSFGFLDAASNERQLALIGAKLRDDGHLVLDIYNRATNNEPAKAAMAKLGAALVKWGAK